jgi:hypothetical protein
MVFTMILNVSLGCLPLPQEAFANISPPADRLQVYASVYPHLFAATHQAEHPAGKHPGRAAALLVESFNGVTRVAELTEAIGGAKITATPETASITLKSEAQIKTILSSRGLSWEEYRTMTRMLAANPDSTHLFAAMMDAAWLKYFVGHTAQPIPDSEQQEIFKALGRYVRMKAPLSSAQMTLQK